MTSQTEHWLFHVTPQLNQSRRSLRSEVSPVDIAACMAPVVLTLTGQQERSPLIVLPALSLSAKKSHKSATLGIWFDQIPILTLVVVDKGSRVAARLWQSTTGRDTAPPEGPWALTWHERGYRSALEPERFPPAELALAWAWLDLRSQEPPTP